jgi:hypothetical protein
VLGAVALGTSLVARHDEQPAGKRNPKLCGERSAAWAQAGIRNAEPRTPARPSETFVSTTRHDALELTLRLAGLRRQSCNCHGVDATERSPSEVSAEKSKHRDDGTGEDQEDREQIRFPGISWLAVVGPLLVAARHYVFSFSVTLAPTVRTEAS